MPLATFAESSPLMRLASIVGGGVHPTSAAVGGSSVLAGNALSGILEASNRAAGPIGLSMRNFSPDVVTQRQQFDTQLAQRQQMLDLLGFNQNTLGEGGLLGTNLFGSVLGSTAPDLVGGITGAAGLSGGGGGGNIGQPGFREDPPGAGGGSIGQPGFREDPPGTGGGGAGGVPSIGGGGGLFGSIIQGRQQLGSDILGDLLGFGGSERARIDRDFQNTSNTALAHLQDRLGGSHSLIAPALESVERGRQQERGALEDRLTAQRIGAKQQIGEGLFGAAENEMGRQLDRQRLGVGLLSNLLGSALNVVNV